MNQMQWEKEETECPHAMQDTLFMKPSRIQLAGLEIVAGNQPNTAIAAMNLGFPPSIVLVPEDGENVTLGKSKLFWNRGLVHIQGPCYSSFDG